MTRWRTTRGWVALVAIGLAGAGIAAALLGGGRIGGDGASEPPPASGPPQQVAATIMEFQQALAGGDFETICSKLFTLEAREAAGGDRCAAVLQDSAGGLTRFDLGPGAQEYKNRFADDHDELLWQTLIPRGHRRYALARLLYAPRQVRRAVAVRLTPEQKARIRGMLRRGGAE